jgi:hypothetical protein
MSDPQSIPMRDDQSAAVDPELLSRAAELRRELERLGVADESGYRIAPALGGTVIRQAGGIGTFTRRSHPRSTSARAT